MKYISKKSHSPQPLTAKNVIARFICLCVGHKNSDFTDSGYQVCKRCGAHEYWDCDMYNRKWIRAGYVVRPFLWIRWKCRKLLYSWKYRNENILPF
jgi:hypothetical protein